MPEPLGERIARRRTALGLTQQELAERIAVSRVAISHLEMGLQVPSERTVALLASVFKCDPIELVADTYYPPAKTERLPPVVARYTAIEQELALLQRDLDWIARLRRFPQARAIAYDVLHVWLDRLALLIDTTSDQRVRLQLSTAQAQVHHSLAQIESQPQD